MRGKKLITLLVIALATIISINLISKNDKKIVDINKDKYTAVEVQKVKYSSIEKYKKYPSVSSAGEVESVKPKTLAKVKSLNVKEGQTVKKGDVLMTLDSSSIDKQLDEFGKINDAIENIEQKVGQSIESINAELIDIKSKKENLYNDRNLAQEKQKSIQDKLDFLETEYSNQQISEEEYEISKKELEEEIAKVLKELEKLKLEIVIIEKSEANLESILKNMNTVNSNNNSTNILDKLEEKKEDYIIRANISGVIEEVNFVVGEMPVNLMKNGILIENNSSLDIEFLIDNSELDEFKKGMEISVYIDTENGFKETVGIIKSISEEANERTKQYSIVVNVNNQNNEFKKGSYCRVLKKVDSKDNILAISKDSIIRDNNKSYVFIEKNGIAIKKEVKLGIENDKTIEVVEGLNENEKVIIKGKEFIQENEKVNIVKEAQ